MANISSLVITAAPTLIPSTNTGRAEDGKEVKGSSEEIVGRIGIMDRYWWWWWWWWWSRP